MRTTVFALGCTVLGVLLGVGLARARLGEATTFVLPTSDGASATGPAGKAIPRVSVDQETYDFGRMERHARQSHDFLFTNVGSAPLELTVGETTCKCTIGEAPDKSIQPGETVSVTLSWTAETDEPEFRQSATIHTNDPIRGSVNLSVVGKVSDASSYFPKSFLFGNVPLGEARVAEVKVVSFLDEPFEVTGYELVAPASRNHFDVEVEDLAKDQFPRPDVRSGYRVKLKTTPELEFGRIGGWLRVKTNLQRVPQVDIPLTGRVVSDVSIVGKDYNDERDLLNLGQVVGAAGAQRGLLIFLQGDRGKEIELRVDETYPEFLQAELGERTEVNERLTQIPLVVRVPPGSPPAVHVVGQDGRPGRIVLSTTHPRVPTLTIDVQFTVE